MCLAELKVSVQPCQHRWYQLLRNCTPTRHLSNCPGKLAIQGWEKKCDSCPWCSRNDLSDNDCRLIGSDRAPTSTGNGFLPPMYQTNPSGRVRRDSCKSNASSIEGEDSLIRVSSIRNREQNLRIEAILPAEPGQSTTSWSRDQDDGDDLPSPSSSRSSVSERSISRFEVATTKSSKVANVTARGAERLGKGWARSRRLFR
ncbi:MAG: hypothetical protein M1837_006586 [Sclerophora amabilis]|nr:MAG: hypothetical protein M1837_006586 [Sclerophora amabilis]